MRILTWVQNKFHGGKEKKRFGEPHCSSPDDPKEEFKDWPQSLLAIGTFGNNEEIKEDSQDVSDFSVEEFNQLQEELKKLLSLKSKSSSRNGSEIMEDDRVNTPLNRFLNFPSRSAVDRTLSTNLESLASDSNGDLSPKTKIMLISKVKDVLLGNPNAIKKKSISFIIKKMFVCSSGFAPAASLRDPIPESRMEKILRAILTKKIQQPPSSAPTAPTKLIENRSTEETQEKAEAGEEGEGKKSKDKCRWVKTDSDFIVLEI
ncbi:protein NEGATIVE GRAVITROPIC RESPONSE OF ROOTS-like isoform X1 [Zingiber officinale]|uniref:protein NEGATIVE GRAVITROPIC RESPONSE OF ROOTS-like isoform X1 n=1 Tax=Zingiber officinale TaxID=94328 RepID=UPI001C4C7881|nr:protein NEGATIVE GRAVITROPIC RESPONSE OF ROOTS-like isoform X1 [Zingiber officinale]XP_042447874.1 protein NEGATIVE GRAVITROPIC RESPONSE OF ROOTS-like isoform X1 [Zingiber officinale]